MEIPVEKVIEKVTEEFRKFGFKAENLEALPTEGKYTFSSEFATGQASFSQKEVACSFFISIENMFVRLHIGYIHHGGGSNGYSTEYIIVPILHIGELEDITLIPASTYRLVMEDLNRKKRERSGD